MSGPLLVVLAGQPGTGKSTLAVRLAGDLRAAYLRIDSIVDALYLSGLTTDLPAGAAPSYPIARNVAESTLRVGTSVVVDAVNPSPEERSGWPALATEVGARLVVLEVVVPDPEEHRRRVDARHSNDERAPTWSMIAKKHYEPWDERRDGPRHRVDSTHREEALERALLLCRGARA